MLAHPSLHLAPHFLALLFCFIAFKSFEEGIRSIGRQPQFPCFTLLVRGSREPESVDCRGFNLSVRD